MEIWMERMSYVWFIIFLNPFTVVRIWLSLNDNDYYQYQMVLYNIFDIENENYHLRKVKFQLNGFKKDYKSYVLHSFILYFLFILITLYFWNCHEYLFVFELKMIVFLVLKIVCIWWESRNTLKFLWIKNTRIFWTKDNVSMKISKAIIITFFLGVVDREDFSRSLIIWINHKVLKAWILNLHIQGKSRNIPNVYSNMGWYKIIRMFSWILFHYTQLEYFS